MGVANDAVDGPDLVVETDDRVRLLRLNRPHRRNALSQQLMLTLSEEVLRADSDPNVHVLLITGTGSDAFCAGADYKEMADNIRDTVPFRPPMDRVERSCFEIVLESRKPTICAINGSAIGGGLELALACDLRVAHRDAKFGLPEVRLGLGANFGSVVLPRRIAPAAALELLFTADFISGEEAYRLGLINHLVEVDVVLELALSTAHRIAANAPISVRRVKAMALRSLEMPIAAALRMDLGTNPYTSEDRQEGIRARNEKRMPQWKNR